MKNRGHLCRGILYLSLVIIGFFFTLWYINAATLDLPVLNDYIREINCYIGSGKIKDYVFSTKFFLQPPVRLLTNWINYNFLGFSVKADMYLGAVGLALEAAVFGAYCLKNKIGCLPYTLFLFYLFSLSKWEMTLHGIGEVHFWAFFGFVLHFYLIDLWYHKQERKQWTRVCMILLPIVNILGVAVFYGAVYAFVTSVLFMILMAEKRKKGYSIKDELVFLCSVDIPMIIYILCSVVNNDTRIVADGSLIGSFLENPLFFTGFFIMSFSSEMIGIETVLSYDHAGMIACAAGIIVLCLYIFCLIINITEKIYGDTYMPLILLVSGLCNHGIILVSRWGFGDITYGMSSRYVLQYLSGGAGIMLTLYIWLGKGKEKKMRWLAVCMAAAVLLIGNMLTTVQEIQKAPYRKAFYDEAKAMFFSCETFRDEELELKFNTDAEEIRKALTVLKEEKLSIWGRISNSLSEDSTLYGRYEDGWLGRRSEFLIAAGEEGILDLECYYPLPVGKGEEIEIEVDGEKNVYPVQEGLFHLLVPCKAGAVSNIKICTNFSISDEADSRERSFVLSNMEGK